jgi:hypothetical protein
MPNTVERVEVEVLHRPTTGQLVQLFGLNPVQSEHARIATRELGRALHWHRWFKPTEANLRTVCAHAAEAGRRVCWSGMPYIAWGMLLPEARTADPIWTAFCDGYWAELDLEMERRIDARTAELGLPVLS